MVFLRHDGTGSSRCGSLALTPGAPTGRPGHDGLLIFLRDLESDDHWRLGDPSGTAGTLRAAHENGSVVLEHERSGIRARLEICVVPGRCAELRRLTLTERTGRARRLDVTTFAEVVLNEPAAHAAHPGFSKLFVQTEADPGRGLLLARRRPRAPQESWPLLAHALCGDGALQWETDRLRWWGRGRAPGCPAALAPGARLGATTGNVLDPVASLRREVDLAPGGTAVLTAVLGLVADRDEARALAGLAADGGAVAAAFASAAADAARDAQARGWTAAEDHAARALAAAVLDGDPALRAVRPVAGDGPATLDLLKRLGQPTGRALVVVAAGAGSATVERLAAMDALWRDLGLPIGMLVLDGPDITGLCRVATADLAAGEPERLLACATLAVTDAIPSPTPPPSSPAAAPERAAVEPLEHVADGLQFDNGLGGFSADGREYVIRLENRADGTLAMPPLPWTNVIANERLGCIASETAIGSAWCDNSRENRLTPWSNDPVLDPPSEIFAVHDQDAGVTASCLPEPAPGAGRAEVRHGFGYTVWRRRVAGLDLETTLHVDRDRPARLVRVRVTNRGPGPRRLALSALTILEARPLSTPSGRFLETWPDAATRALLATDGTAGAFADHVTFACAVPDAGPVEVLAEAGMHGHLRLEASFPLAGGEQRTVTFVLGQERGEAAALAHVRALDTPAACETSWDHARAFWRDGLGALQVSTPSPALDLMLGGWLAYQTLSCRVRGRSAFYQSGGAFGYRDQLQDSLALLPYWPDHTRRQIVLHAGHQFVEGDVLHWWHPPMTAGIRTRFADDLLWLPYIACEYARQTGDVAVFDEQAPYLTAPALPEGEDEVFVHAKPSGLGGSVFEHCCRALDRSLAVGAHGLPLFGTGDWNDGMNRVGRLGRGESTWMGFFLVSIIDAFAPLCDERGDKDRADRYRAHREHLAAALNDGGWDGQWYRRGYYDDGAPLGSHENRECRIDALAQAWSVLSRVAPPERAAAALDQVEAQLINDDERLVRLLTPPFVDTPRDPGYIRGYVAGVRENGGQYTHAATWVVRAMAEQGRRDRAAQLLDLLNPVLHAATPAQVSRYKVEPYVVAADVYGAAPHVGRGGWTWYTGSSGWLQRVALESVLGLRTRGGDTLVVAPCIPDGWPGFRLTWRLPGDGTTYEVDVRNPSGCSRAVVAATVDGVNLAPRDGQAHLPLHRDGGRHVVTVTLGSGGGNA
ncbi:MAG: glycosyl transferase [bacterium]|nr:glycosyl transferase [bacterium]